MEIRIIVEKKEVVLKNISKNTNYKLLKEYLRDNLGPWMKNTHNWDAIVERIRDAVGPYVN